MLSNSKVVAAASTFVSAFVAAVRDAFAAEQKQEGFSLSMVRTFAAAFFAQYDAAGIAMDAGTDDAATLAGRGEDEVEAFAKEFRRDVTKAIRADYSAEVVKEANGLDSGAIAWGEGSASARELCGRVRVARSRMSEAKAILSGYVSGNVAAVALLTDENAPSVSAVLAAVRAEKAEQAKEAGEGDAGEGETETDGFDLAAALATVIQSARKRNVSDADIAAAFAQAIGAKVAK